MVTPAQARANVESATRLLARTLGIYSNDGSGFDYGALSPSNQITLTNALAQYIKDNPHLFDTGATDHTNPVLSAEFSTNAPLISSSASISEFTDAFLGNARALNPLDPQNLPTVAKWVVVGAVVLGAVWILANSDAARRALSK